MKKTVLAAALAALVALPLVGHSKTLTWSSQGDFMTLDPHAQNENLIDYWQYRMCMSAWSITTRTSRLTPGTGDFLGTAGAHGLAIYSARRREIS